MVSDDCTSQLVPAEPVQASVKVTLPSTARGRPICEAVSAAATTLGVAVPVAAGGVVVLGSGRKLDSTACVSACTSESA